MAKDSKHIQVPKWCAVLGAIVFVGGMLVVGLCVYYLSPPRPTEGTTDSYSEKRLILTTTMTTTSESASGGTTTTAETTTGGSTAGGTTTTGGSTAGGTNTTDGLTVGGTTTTGGSTAGSTTTTGGSTAGGTTTTDGSTAGGTTTTGGSTSGGTASTIATTTGGPTTPPLSEEYRLPRHILPDTYEIRLLPFLDNGNFTFNGHVNISVTCVEPSSNITLHYSDMTITSAVEVKSANGETLRVVGTSYNVENNHFVIFLYSVLTVGHSYTVSMDFVGNINNELDGFYRASYVDTNGTTRHLALTQFEPIGARRAFPCFDEPNMKAKFTLTLGRTIDRNTHSNVRIIEQGRPVEGVPGMVWDIYEQTPQKMSTYLVAFIVSDFQKFEGRPTKSGAETAVIVNPTFTAKEAKLPLRITPTIAEYFEEYTGINYTFPKIDQVGVKQFRAGAMENWGLIIYRDEYLLSSTVFTVQIIAHELVHQWFGNLVTLDWWSAIFLNEGFATMMKYKGIAVVFPKWRPDDMFVSETLQSVMRGSDSLDSTRPMYFPVNDNNIRKYFDSVAYEKSGSVLRMFEDAVGAATFQNGIRQYLQARKFQNSKVEDLTFFLNKAAIEDGVILPEDGLIPAMNSWIYQKNFPLITVTRNYTAGKASLTQKRFVRGPNITEDYYWWIPLTYTQDFAGETSRLWLSNTTNATELSGLANDKFVVFNVGQKGYYRANYDEENWLLITQALTNNLSSIGYVNRAQILDDALNLARYGLVDYPVVLSLMKFLVNEREWLPWSSFDANAVYLNNMLSGQPAYAYFQVYMQRILKPFYGYLKLEFKPEGLLTLLTRILAVEWACKLGLPECVQTANALYDKLVEQDGVNNGTVPPHFMSTVLCTAIRNGDGQDFDNAVNMFKRSTEKTGIAAALTCTTDAVLIDKLLGWTITEVDSPIQKGDTKVTDTIYWNLANNPLGSALAFNFILSKWEEIKTFYSEEVGARWLRFVSAYFSKSSQTEELIAFHDAHLDQPLVVSALTPAIERAQANLAWATNNYQVIADWLTNEVIGGK